LLHKIFFHLEQIRRLLQVLTIHFNEKVVQPDDQSKQVVRVVKFGQLIQRLKYHVFLSVLWLAFHSQLLRSYTGPFFVEKYIEVNIGEFLKNLFPLIVYYDGFIIFQPTRMNVFCGLNFFHLDLKSLWNCERVDVEAFKGNVVLHPESADWIESLDEQPEFGFIRDCLHIFQ
jgi:hypothetical protein